MDIKLNEYLDIFDPIKKEYFPIRVIAFTEKGISVKFLKSRIEREIQHYHIKTYGYKKSFINNEMIKDCGFTYINGLEYHKENQIIIECLIGQIRVEPYPFYIDFASNYFGYKFLNNHHDYVNFKEILSNTEINTPVEKFKLEYSTTTQIETLRDFVNLPDAEFDQIYLEAFNRNL
ncbi:hypothetical protein [Chryseobacterium sp. CT-SW4]|uniref:hypothetical protein n=1 Tax=Chryseobacterium sp. SW-1 TaxID=3157343 RepID=UPI003B02B1CB